MAMIITEDFSSWVAEDSDNRLSVGKNKVQWNHADRTKVRYISNDLGRGSIADFEHTFDVRMSEAFAASKDHRGLLRFWECRNDWDNRIWIYARVYTDFINKWTIHFEQKNDNNDLCRTYLSPPYSV